MQCAVRSSNPAKNASMRPILVYQTSWRASSIFQRAMMGRGLLPVSWNSYRSRTAGIDRFLHGETVDEEEAPAATTTTGQGRSMLRPKTCNQTPRVVETLGGEMASYLQASDAEWIRDQRPGTASARDSVGTGLQAPRHGRSIRGLGRH